MSKYTVHSQWMSGETMFCTQQTPHAESYQHTIYMMPFTSIPNSNKGISQSDGKRVMDAFNWTRTSVKYHPSYLSHSSLKVIDVTYFDDQNVVLSLSTYAMPYHLNDTHILWGSHMLWFAWTLSETYNLFKVVSLSYRRCSTLMLSRHIQFAIGF